MPVKDKKLNYEIVGGLGKIKIVEEGELAGIGTVYRAYGSSEEQIAAFQAKGIGFPYLASVEDVARIWEAKVSDYWFSRLSLAAVGFEDENPVLYKHSPLMNRGMARYLKFINSEGGLALDKEFYANIREIAKNEEKLPPELRTVQVLRDLEYKLTPDMDESKFLFGSFTEKYLGDHKVLIYCPDKDYLRTGVTGIVPMFFGDGDTIGYGMTSWPGMTEGTDEAFGILRKEVKK